MSEEFLILQKLIKENKVEIRLKKSVSKGIFDIWLYCASETKKPKFCWKTIFVLYWVFSSFWFWLIISIIFAIKINFLCLFGILVPGVIMRLLSQVGWGFMVGDLQKDEELFDDFWKNQFIGIMSTAEHEGLVPGKNIPDVIIDPYSHNWRERISLLASNGGAI